MRDWWFSLTHAEQIQMGILTAVSLRMAVAWIHLIIYIKFKRKSIIDDYDGLDK